MRESRSQKRQQAMVRMAKEILLFFGEFEILKGFVRRFKQFAEQVRIEGGSDRADDRYQVSIRQVRAQTRVGLEGIAAGARDASRNSQGWAYSMF